MHSAGNSRILLVVILMITCFSAFAQVDSSRKRSLDSIILRQKGIIGKLAHNLLRDTMVETMQGLLRTDQPFQRYSGRVIRDIRIQTKEFEIVDSSARFNNKLKRLSDKLHRRTRDFVIRNHLFFSRNDRLSPYVLGDNERHLRDLPFTRDASIRVRPVRGSRDSVDIVVVTNDVLSIGGSLRLHNTETVSASIEEDNFLGYGDQVSVKGLYDGARSEHFGYGFDFTKRNIMGSFVNVSAGFTNFAKTINLAEREERNSYFRLARPLVNRFMKWTYGGEVEWHKTQNFYSPDSVYFSDYQYKYDIVDVWASLNMDADKPDGAASSQPRLRRLLGLRILQQEFDYRPLKFNTQYDYRYADLKAVLGSFSIFKQNFYKTQYIYGFGRNEDVPEGLEGSFTAGWTKKQGRERPFAGFSFQHYFFNQLNHYFNYSFAAGTFLYKKNLEDIDLLGKLEYFSALHQLNKRWKQRYFFGASVTKQVNSVLGEPVRLESEYGLEELRNNNASGNFRATVKAESVFFSPWSVLFFRFAPFVFTNATYINLKIDNESVPKLYASIGGGVRIRNESLIFGTTEFRGMYFPRKNFRNESWRIEVNTNIRFKYNRDFIKRPEFVRVN